MRRGVWVRKYFRPAALGLCAAALACDSTASTQIRNRAANDPRADQSRHAGPAPQQPDADSISKQLKLQLSVEKSVWDDKSEARVRLQLVNASERALDIGGLASFHLFREGVRNEREGIQKSYYALANLQAPGAAVRDAPLSSINLPPGQSIEESFELSKLLWGRTIGASLPRQDLREAVPKGDYRLRFDVRVHQVNTKGDAAAERLANPVRVVSNEVRVSIQ